MALSRRPEHVSSCYPASWKCSHTGTAANLPDSHNVYEGFSVICLCRMTVDTMAVHSRHGATWFRVYQPDFYASATTEKRCRRHSGIGSVRPWASESMRPNTLWTPCQKQWLEFHLILVTDVFGFIDVLIRFWGQNSKDQRSRSPQAKE